MPLLTRASSGRWVRAQGGGGGEGGGWALDCCEFVIILKGWGSGVLKVQ